MPTKTPPVTLAELVKAAPDLFRASAMASRPAGIDSKTLFQGLVA